MKPAAGEVVDERLVDRRALELEDIEVFGERQLGDGELVLDRARLLLADLGLEQIAAQSSLRRLRKLGCVRCGSCWRLTAVAMISRRQACAALRKLGCVEAFMP
jgi:hypothetical protein